MSEKKDTIKTNTGGDVSGAPIIWLLEHDNYFIFVHKKSERISSALYLMSNLLSDSDSLKWRLRELGVSLVSHSLSFKQSAVIDETVLSSFVLCALKIRSLLSVAHTSGLVSDMNFEIVRIELENLVDSFAVETLSKSKKGFSFTRDFFSISETNLSLGRSRRVSTDDKITEEATLQSWEDVKKMEEFYTGHFSKPHAVKDKDVAGSSFVLDAQNSVKTGYVPKSPVSKIQNSRETQIISLLKKRDNLSVKDLTIVIKDFSEKTIQRELLRLVKVGVLKKVGERRWSRYSLVHATV